MDNFRGNKERREDASQKLLEITCKQFRIAET